MFRTIFTLGAAVLVGVLALKFLAAFVGGLLFFLIGLAIKVLIIGTVVYFAMSLFAPDTLRRWRESWSAR